MRRFTTERFFRMQVARFCAASPTPCHGRVWHSGNMLQQVHIADSRIFAGDLWRSRRKLCSVNRLMPDGGADGIRGRTLCVRISSANLISRTP